MPENRRERTWKSEVEEERKAVPRCALEPMWASEAHAQQTSL